MISTLKPQLELVRETRAYACTCPIPGGGIRAFSRAGSGGRSKFQLSDRSSGRHQESAALGRDRIGADRTLANRESRRRGMGQVQA